MKIAFLINKFPLLSETFILNQITGLIDRGHTVDIFVRGLDPQPKRHPDVARYRLEAIDLHQDRIEEPEVAPLRQRTLRSLLAHAGRRPGLLLTCAQLLRHRGAHTVSKLYPVGELLRRGPYDIVHAHYGMNGVWAVRLRNAGAFTASIVTTFHDGFDLSGHLKAQGPDAYREVFEQGDLLLPISEYVSERLSALGAPRSKLVQHRVGIDLRRFDFARDTVPTSPVRILSVARLVEMKGIEFGLRALAPLVSEFPDIRYTVAGDGPLRGYLEELARTLHLAEHVEWLGWRDQAEVTGLLQRSQIFLAPSVTAGDGAQEGIPTVLMEAMASRLPVVGTRYSGIPELVRDGVDGYLTAERDVDAIRTALSRLVQDADRRSAMGKQGRTRVAELHDIELLNDQLELRYRQLIRR